MKKAYLDDDVVSVIAKDENGAESAALDLLLAAYRERKVDLVTSAVTLKELESYQGPQRPAIKRIFGFLKKEPNACVPMIQNNPRLRRSAQTRAGGYRCLARIRRGQEWVPSLSYVRPADPPLQCFH
jgi:hypothetical protein